MNSTFKRTVAGALSLSLLGAQFVLALPAQAAVSSWYKGANVFPTSTTDFNSSGFQQSLRNLKATGANYVALVVPYYQSNTGSTDIQNGWNTPTDDSLASAIDFAHSIGLSVAIKVHIEPYTGDWRANINPGDRDTWFQKYGDNLVHLGTIGQAHHAEMMILGTELVSMASDQINGSNSQHWFSMIGRVRAVFSGLLSYDANATNNNGNPFEEENTSVNFWSALDVVSLSAYYNLNTNDNSVASLEGQWDYWNNSEIMKFQQKVGKPIIFGEIGYRSVDQAHQAPWDSGRGGGYNPTEQANDYQALMDYWNKYSYMNGVFWWDWNSNPNAGGNGDTSYTPQNKPAQQVMTQWFTTPSTPPAKATFTVSGGATPTNISSGQMSTLSATVNVTGATLQNALIDLEVYDKATNKRVYQKFYENQTIAAGSKQTFSTQWMPSAGGQYRMTIGVFTAGWASSLYWNDDAADITVGGGVVTPPPTQGPVATNIWWPASNSHVSGVQPFKANLDGLEPTQYMMYWQVDGGTLVQMSNSNDGYPHKESLVDLSSWSWKGQGPYTITFVSKNASGSTISQKSTQIWIP
jgi:hypothetical protein